MRKLTLVLTVCFFSLLAPANEFWLRPQKFFFTIREVANIRFRTGDHFPGENWSGNHTQLQSLLHYTPSGSVINIAATLSDTVTGDSLQVPLGEEGTHMVTFNSAGSFRSMEAGPFTASLISAGLEPALLYRKAHGEENTKGNENYQYSVKTVFQVGGRLTDACTLPTELPLDIIPEENPYTVPKGTDSRAPVKLRFQVLFHREAAARVLVKTWYYDESKRIKTDTARTNRRGWVTVDRHSGPFMVSCVVMERKQRADSAQWQSYRASLCFEYSKFYPGKSANYPALGKNDAQN